MSAQRNPIVKQLLVLAACSNLAVSCPHEYDAMHDFRRAELPAHAVSARVEIRVVVPEGDWELRIEGAGHLTISAATADPRAEIEDLSWERRGASFAPFEYGLHCARGKCPFVFEVAATRGTASALVVTAGILVTYIAADGCDRTAPDYVPEDDRERLFEIAFRSYDVVVAPRDAGVNGRASEAGFVAIPTLDGGLDASAGGDVEVEGAAQQDASSPEDAEVGRDR